MQWWRVVGAIGRFMMRAGVLVLLFVAYQLWGTGLATAPGPGPAEERVRQPAGRPPRPTSTESTTSTTAAGAGHRARRPPRPRRTAIRSDACESPPSASTSSRSRASTSPTSRRDRATSPRPRCRASPATSPSPATARPTWRRSTASTSSSPATRSPSTPCRARSPTRSTPTTSAPGEAPSGHFIVKPTQVEILDQDGTNKVTLMACNPKYSARERIVVTATLAVATGAGHPDPGRRPARARSPPTPRSTPSPAATPSALGARPLLDRRSPSSIWFLTWFVARPWPAAAGSDARTRGVDTEFPVAQGPRLRRRRPDLLRGAVRRLREHRPPAPGVLLIACR